MADAPHGSNEGPLAGLTSEQAQAGLLEHGRNEIPETVTWEAIFERCHEVLSFSFVGGKAKPQ